MSRGIAAAGAFAAAAWVALAGTACSNSSGQVGTAGGSGGWGTSGGVGGSGAVSGSGGFGGSGGATSACGVCDGCCSGTECIPAAFEDWLACGASGAACGTCDYGGTCVGGACSDVIDPTALFNIVVTGLQVAEHDPSGAAWDVLGGLPDPYVCATDAQDNGGCTSSCTDTTSCVPVTNTISDSSGTPLLFDGATLAAGVTISVYDEDVSVNDPMGTTTRAIIRLSQFGYSVPAFGSVTTLSLALE